MVNAAAVRDWTDQLYLATLVRNQPRSIDRYIDYFGLDGEVRPRDAGALSAKAWR